ncbi:MAG: hypothetical protein Ct9H90mP13_00200 [Pseudomonadota bacterium]|nr:MAG: hypothetical protein Ct9H90mP13_00200 [Pseudomonadota bacterium]
MNKRLNNLIFVWLIMLLTTMMTIMPLPDFLYGIRIEWVAMAVIFFSIMNVSLMGVIAASITGTLIGSSAGWLARRTCTDFFCHQLFIIPIQIPDSCLS